MRGDSALRVLQWCSISLPDAGEKLMQDVIPVQGDDAVLEILESARFFSEEVSEVNTHEVSTSFQGINAFLSTRYV